jgi:transposase-like protein
VAGRTTYTDDELARLYVALTANEGNVKRTARDTGVPESTVRKYRDQWEREGPPNVGEVEAAVTDFTADAERVRNKALASIEEKIPGAKVGELTTLVGVLDDKIQRARGLAIGRVEHVHTLPPAEEIKAVLGAVFQGSLEAASQRESEIVDAEIISVEEQAPKALPAGRP